MDYIPAKTFFELAAHGTTAYLVSTEGRTFLECNTRNMADTPGNEAVMAVSAYDGELRLHVNQSANVLKHWKRKYGE